MGAVRIFLGGFLKTTGWMTVIVLTAVCYGFIWLRHTAGYGWFDGVSITVSEAIIIGTYAVLFLNYLMVFIKSLNDETMPPKSEQLQKGKPYDPYAPFSYEYLPGVRNVDGTVWRHDEHQ